MLEDQRWCLAWARFEALRSNIPELVDETVVHDYHSILEDLQKGCGQDLAKFRIPESELRPRIEIGIVGHPGDVRYGDEKCCDVTYFRRQVDGVWRYVWASQARTGEPMDEQKSDYWSMTAADLRERAKKYHIPLISTSGDFWLHERRQIVDELVKRHQALGGASNPPVLNIGTVIGSSIQQGTQGSPAIVNFKVGDPDLNALLLKIKDALERIELSPQFKHQITADVATIQAQLPSPSPRASVISERLHSIRTILETVTGNVIASSMLAEIARFLPH